MSGSTKTVFETEILLSEVKYVPEKIKSIHSSHLLSLSFNNHNQWKNDSK